MSPFYSILFALAFYLMCVGRVAYYCRVVLDVEIFQDRLQASSLLLPALIGARRLGVQAAFG